MFTKSPMKKTRRVQILLIDNYDSFTYNLYDYFLQLGTECRVIRNDEMPLAEVQQLSFDALVLSPGPKTPTDAGWLMPLIENYASHKPILGICLGHQGLGLYFGAQLLRAPLPMHGKTSTLKHTGHPIFKNLPPQFEVMRYHSLILEDLKQTPLEVIAATDEQEVMAVAHRHLPLVGVQFHPESILTEYGLEMLDNWLEWVGLKSLERST